MDKMTNIVAAIVRLSQVGTLFFFLSDPRTLGSTNMSHVVSARLAEREPHG
jgi:hypothetical protein